MHKHQTAMQRITITYTYILKWQVSDAPEYCFSACGRLFNTKRGKEVKKVMQGRAAGYNIRGKFISLSALRPKIVKLQEVEVPF
jgi:hypothetical protein